MNGALRGGHGTIKPLNELTATEIIAGIGQGRITCEAVVQACLERVDAREREVHAWAYIDATTALVSARAFDKNGRRGPFAGVPFGVKDIIDSYDMPTEWGTPIHKGRQPERDAACVALSRKAGG
ncbi:MAG TPA: amidase family protein, partial [Xanthobacteraceae bacterium]